MFYNFIRHFLFLGWTLQLTWDKIFKLYTNGLKGSDIRLTDKGSAPHCLLGGGILSENLSANLRSWLWRMLHPYLPLSLNSVEKQLLYEVLDIHSVNFGNWIAKELARSVTAHYEMYESTYILRLCKADVDKNWIDCLLS